MCIHCVSSVQSNVEEGRIVSKRMVARIVVARPWRTWMIKGASLAMRLEEEDEIGP